MWPKQRSGVRLNISKHKGREAGSFPKGAPGEYSWDPLEQIMLYKWDQQVIFLAYKIVKNIVTYRVLAT